MSISTSFINIILNSGINTITNQYGNLRAKLFYSGTEISGGDYTYQTITGWSLATTGIRTSNALDFTSFPLSSSYDEIRIYTSGGSLVANKSIDVQTLDIIDTHTITINISGS